MSGDIVFPLATNIVYHSFYVVMVSIVNDETLQKEYRVLLQRRSTASDVTMTRGSSLLFILTVTR